MAEMSTEEKDQFGLICKLQDALKALLDTPDSNVATEEEAVQMAYDAIHKADEFLASNMPNEERTRK